MEESSDDKKNPQNTKPSASLTGTELLNEHLDPLTSRHIKEENQMKTDSFALEKSQLFDMQLSLNACSLRIEMPSGWKTVLSKTRVGKGHSAERSRKKRGNFQTLTIAGFPSHCHAAEEKEEEEEEKNPNPC